ncbi:MAG: DUF374 domain-containing protein [Rickettsiales bacterium]
MKKIIKNFLRSKFTQVVLSFFIFLYLQLVFFTSRKKYIFEDVSDQEFYKNNHFILAFWHGRLAMMPFIKSYLGKKTNVLISQHRDGRIIAYVMRFFLYGIISGSSSKGWFQAFKRMSRLNKNKENIVITPDGPRGPRQKVGQSNIIKLALKFDLQICPTTFSISKARIMNSWDKFVFPLPFSNIIFLFGKRIDPKDKRFSSEEMTKDYFEEAMNSLCEKADSMSGIDND